MIAMTQDSLFANGEDTDALVALATKALESRLRATHPNCVRDSGTGMLNTPEAARQLFALRLAGEWREHMDVAFLDSKHQLIEVKRLFSGGLSGCEIHPGVIAREALLLNASAIILAHNHPSGAVDASAADRALTARVKQALAPLDVRLLDHIIVAGPDTTTSMAEKGGV